MALLNIGAGNQDDAFYRYKMPRMITKIEGRGNGIKTNIVNMVDIAKALGRPASYTTKYFGTELGAQSKYDEKMGTSHVNGAHETSKLAALLEAFINKYVQCYGCGNPETEIVITKSHMIALKCAACGFISEVDMRDKLTTFIVKNPPEQKKGSKDKKVMRRAEKERLKEGEIADEEQKKLKKDGRKKGTPKSVARRKSHPFDEDCNVTDHEKEASFDDDDGDSEDEVEWQTDTSAEAALQRIQEQLNSVTAGMVVLSTDEEGSKSGKVSPANSPSREDKHKTNGMKSVRSRDKLVGLKSVKSRDKLNDEVKGNGKANHRMRSVRSRDNLHDGIKNSKRVGNKLRSVSSSENISEGMKDNRRASHRLSRVSSRDSIVDETSENVTEENTLKAVNSQENLVVEIKDYLKKGPPAVEKLKSFLGSLSGTHQEIVDALFEALFNEVGKGFSKEVVKKKNFLAAATPDEGSQLVLLHSIESFCDKASPDAMKEIALVLKSLYDNDVLEENFIFEWYNKGMVGENKNSTIWKNVKPFVEWLQSAESETEGE